MLASRRHLRAIMGMAALGLGLAIICGCGKKDDEPTAPGYYSGPMKPKGGGNGTAGKKVQGSNNSTAAGEP